MAFGLLALRKSRAHSRQSATNDGSYVRVEEEYALGAEVVSALDPLDELKPERAHLLKVTCGARKRD